jgi:hypothetical protein
VEINQGRASPCRRMRYISNDRTQQAGWIMGVFIVS